VYGVLSLAAVVFVIFMVPETKGHTLEEIELEFDRSAAPHPAE
jgi:hypothetical protein